MSLWWLQPGWDQTPCSCCGATIAPEGDPDCGLCWPCMSAEQERQRYEEEYVAEQNAAEQRAYDEQYFREHPHG